MSFFFFFFKQKTAYEMRISDWSSDVCSSDLGPIGEMLGADRVIATRLEIADGKYTGEIDYYAYAETKAEAIRELAESEGYDLAHCYAYSDSVTDAPLLGTAGHPFAVNPDKALRKLAVENERPIRL